MPKLTFAEAIHVIEDRGWTLTYNPKDRKMFVYTVPSEGSMMVGGAIGKGRGGDREEVFKHTVVCAVYGVFWRQSKEELRAVEDVLEEERAQGKLGGKDEEVPGGVMHGMRIGWDNDKDNEESSHIPNPETYETIFKLARDLCTAWLDHIPSEELPIREGSPEEALLQRCSDAGMFPKIGLPRESLVWQFLRRIT